jgi:hypothetical protein
MDFILDPPPLAGEGRMRVIEFYAGIAIPGTKYCTTSPIR